MSVDEYERGNPANPVVIRYPHMPVISYLQHINSMKTGTEIVGENRAKRNKLFYGIKIQYSRYKLTQQLFPGSLKDKNWESYRSFYIEDVYNLKPQFGFIAGLKYENTERGYGRDIEGLIWRVGTVYFLNKSDYIKLFLSKYYTPPFFVEVRSNPNLKIQKNRGLTFEYSGIYPIGKIVITGGMFSIKDNILISPSTYSYVNINKKLRYYFWSVEDKKAFNNGIYINAGYFKVYPEKREYKTSSSEGGLFRIGVQQKNYSAFVENIYRKGYGFYGKWIKSGFELNAGIKINLFDNTKVAIKGYNLLDKGIKTPLLNDKNVQIYQEDRRVLITLERDF